MTRTFLHSFDPPASNPVTGATVDLGVSEIEDAGIREVLQTPGAAYGAWSILDALLTPIGAGTPFIFRELLGQAREVKVALSGLFGRFVARAYLAHRPSSSMMRRFRVTTCLRRYWRVRDGTGVARARRISGADTPLQLRPTASSVATSASSGIWFAKAAFLARRI